MEAEQSPGPNRAAVGAELARSGIAELNKVAVLRNMQEMFSNLDPQVIDDVLSEVDFKGENI